MLTGSDVRRFRLLIGMTQVEFARRLGITQGTLSQVESGRIGLSQEYVTRLEEQFRAGEFKQGFREFRQEVEAEGAASIAAARAAGALFHTMTVWKWDERFDLGRTPLPDQAAGLVTLEAGNAPRVALQMGRAADGWANGEIIVFEKIEVAALNEGDLCLVQVRDPRFKGKRTAIAVARPAPAKRERVVEFQPVSPAAPMLIADEQLVAVFRACYRARYT